MLHGILKDIKSMLKRPLVFMILFLGLLASAASIIVYYTYGTYLYARKDSAMIFRNCIEFEQYTYDKEGDLIYDYIVNELANDPSLPDILYASAWENGDLGAYDKIGLIQYKNFFKSPDSEVHFIPEEQDKLIFLMTEGAYADAAIGESKFINGRDMTIIGIADSMSYIPEYFDTRRAPKGLEYLAGKSSLLNDRKQMRSLEEMVSEECIIMPFKVAVESGEPYIFRIVFNQPLTDAQREGVISGLNKFIYPKVINTTDLGEIYSFVMFSEFLIYAAALLAGIINMIALFAFFIRENRHQYQVYKLVGASNGRITALLLSELGIYTLIPYLIAACGATPLMSKIEFFENCHMPTPAGSAMLFLIMLGIACIVCMGQIRSILRIKKAQRSKPYEKKRAPLVISKQLKLLGYNYSRKNAVNIVSIICLALTVAFTFTYAMTYVYEAGRYERYYQKHYKYEAYIPNLIVNEDVQKAYLKVRVNEISDLMEDEAYRTFYETFTGLDGIIATGKRYPDYLSANLDKEDDTNISYGIYTYDKGYLENIFFGLKHGSQQELIDYDPTNEVAPIPCLITEAMAKEYPIGSIIPFDMRFHTGNIVNYYDPEEPWNTEIQMITDDISRELKVVGIVDDDSFIASDNSLTYDANMDPTHPQITDIFQQWQRPIYSQDTEVSYIHHRIFAPAFYHKGRLPFDHTEEIIIFSEEYDPQQLAEWKEKLAPLCQVISLNFSVQNYENAYDDAGGDIYILHTMISAVLLIFGIGGFSIIQFSMNRRMYGIFYTCGMTWGKAILHTLLTNAINTLIPAIVGSLFGIFIARSLRTNFAAESIVLSALSGIGIVLAMYIVSSLIIAAALRSKRPKSLLTEEAK